jgi:ribonuclease HI
MGIAIVAENITIIYKLPTECSIYTAEALAIYNAVLYILHNKETTPNNYLIISDTLSSITGIQNTTHPSDISKLIQEKTYEARNMEIDLCYAWVPGHCGIHGNKKADLEASKAASSPDTSLLNVYTYEDKKKQTKQVLNHEWHKMWTNQSTKLNQIKNNIQTWHSPGLKRKEETILNRLQIGHTFITHKHLMEKNDPPICEMCGVVYTVKHIITECQKYEDMRKKHQISQQIGEALGPDPQSITKILQFIKIIQLYNLI